MNGRGCSHLEFNVASTALRQKAYVLAHTNDRVIGTDDSHVCVLNAVVCVAFCRETATRRLGCDDQILSILATHTRHT